MARQFYWGFKNGLGPWVNRETSRDIPTGLDCANVVDGKLVLRIKSNPLRTGHIWVPPDVFQTTTGFIEARMKFRAPKGSHGSVWAQALQPYATRDDHEVDVVENFGNPLVAHHGIWTQDDYDPEPDQVLHGTWRGDMSNYNVYGCEMRADGYTFTVNDKVITSTTQYASTLPKYLVASQLISEWELKFFNADDIRRHRTLVDWVQVTDL